MMVLTQWDNPDFALLCAGLELAHRAEIREQRSPRGNCLVGNEKFRFVFIYYVGDAPAGCAAITGVEADGSVELGRVYVYPAFRGKGIAKKLISISLSLAKGEGGSRVVLDTYRRFEAAVHLYEALGFKEIENFKAYSPYSICMEYML